MHACVIVDRDHSCLGKDVSLDIINPYGLDIYLNVELIIRCSSYNRPVRLYLTNITRTVGCSFTSPSLTDPFNRPGTKFKKLTAENCMQAYCATPVVIETSILLTRSIEGTVLSCLAIYQSGIENERCQMNSDEIRSDELHLSNFKSKYSCSGISCFDLTVIFF